MKMKDLTPPVPPTSVSVESVPAGGAPRRGLEPGDILLGQAHGIKHRIIKFGQGLRIRGTDRRYTGYTHAALVVSRDGDLIEAVGEGLRRSTVLDYVARDQPYQVVHIDAAEEDRMQAVAFAEEKLARNAPYGALANVSTTVWAVTGCRLMFFLDGSYTCSGLVASALERTTAIFDVNAARVMPAQLAVYFKAPLPPPDAAWPRPSWWPSFGRGAAEAG